MFFGGHGVDGRMAWRFHSLLPEMCKMLVCTAIYLGVIMLLSTVSLTVSVLVLNLHHCSSTTHRPPHWV